MQLRREVAQRDQRAVPVQQPRVRPCCRLGPVQPRALERLGRPAGRARRRGPSRARRTRARRPSRTASASSGSVWSVKYCHGVEAPHSSPMNSIGVNGEVSSSAAPPGQHAGRQQRARAGRPSPGCRPGRGSAARRRTATRARAPGRPAGRACGRGTSSRCRRGRTACVSALASAPGVGEVGVVALRLAGQRGVQARGGSRRLHCACRPSPPRLAAGRHRARVVAVGLGDQRTAAGRAPRRARPPRATAPRAGAAARSSCSACTASRRSPSTW